MTSLMRSKAHVLMVHFAMIRFDGASGACQSVTCDTFSAHCQSSSQERLPASESRMCMSIPARLKSNERHVPMLSHLVWRNLCWRSGYGGGGKASKIRGGGGILNFQGPRNRPLSTEILRNRLFWGSEAQAFEGQFLCEFPHP